MLPVILYYITYYVNTTVQVNCILCPFAIYLCPYVHVLYVHMFPCSCNAESRLVVVTFLPSWSHYVIGHIRTHFIFPQVDSLASALMRLPADQRAQWLSSRLLGMTMGSNTTYFARLFYYGKTPGKRRNGHSGIRTQDRLLNQ